jgi:hypothetical protein
VATSDKLSLLLDALWKGKENLTSLEEGSKGPYISNLDEDACSTTFLEIRRIVIF